MAKEQAQYLPTRFLIKFISCLTREEVVMVDQKFNRNIIRLPLLLYPWASGLLSSLTTSFIKGVSELVNSAEIMENIQRPQIYVLLILVVVSLISQLHFMNLSLKCYD